ncbi:MAG: LysR family transcriptional regulator [Oceanospirillaceae bacterium]|uniref:LysR substrate-binding domain-containing protein n=1 Tax=unclassified Thalassolituus TaxID=2624967 RepID=UPI000C09C94B|nr:MULTISPECIES: LysR substrate-binding domain-containing protein [unclassified Thalassolituus]MAK90790.1 LysR family transcriptional regulator [Thalassolituus sp.]MAS24181.1 LysR family transcriptional regulator [Oceanospirillaceae bacterium]MBL34667.1 LysR family transcriptional regulator [Oceanospirillaceae bacterium]MBS52463.1 LysR family transcriptional regulator [Oceanospirillaceae bacterium]|tara:strand:+ start:1551 stop:2513 length:963 start_codon:yes stop_codon:yes gene_type:complete
MDLRQLKYFVVVAEEGNIGRAALRLHISQPPLTRQIQQLEESLGVQLFLRTPKGVELTEPGQLLLDEARNIQKLVSLAQERTQKAGKGELGQLDVGIFGSAIFDTIPKILQAFRKRHPDVNVVLHTMEKGKQIEALRQRRIAVGFNRVLAPLPDIVSEVIAREKLFIAVSDQSPLAKEKSLSIKTLATEPFIAFPNAGRPNFVDKVFKLCQEHGFLPNVVQEVGDASTAVALAACGFGICLVPASATKLSLPGVLYKPVHDLPEGSSVDLSCVYLKDHTSPILQSFLQVVRDMRLSCEEPCEESCAEAAVADDTKTPDKP